MNRKASTKIAVTVAGNGKSASIIDLDESNFDQTIRESPVPILIDFFASWCGPCHMLAPVLDEIAMEQGENLKLAKVDVDTSPRLIIRFGISNIPTVLFFKDGELKDQLVGRTTKAELISRLKSLN